MWTKQELANKIDDEGGIAGFLRWGGVDYNDIPPDIANIWVAMISAWEDFEQLAQMFTDELPEPNYDEF